MTKAIYLIIISGILFSCQGILDKEPIATLDAGSFSKPRPMLYRQSTLLYGPLMFNNQNNNFYWAFSTITSDEAITGGDGSRPGLVEMDAFTYTPEQKKPNTFWKVNYEGITQCNVVLANLDKAEMVEDQKKWDQRRSPVSEVLLLFFTEPGIWRCALILQVWLHQKIWKWPRQRPVLYWPRFTAIVMKLPATSIQQTNGSTRQSNKGSGPSPGCQNSLVSKRIQQGN